MVGSRPRGPPRTRTRVPRSGRDRQDHLVEDTGSGPHRRRSAPCDEFPFASSKEGAGIGDENFSVRCVPGRSRFPHASPHARFESSAHAKRRRTVPGGELFSSADRRCRSWCCLFSRRREDDCVRLVPVAVLVLLRSGLEPVARVGPSLGPHLYFVGTGWIESEVCLTRLRQPTEGVDRCLGRFGRTVHRVERGHPACVNSRHPTPAGSASRQAMSRGPLGLRPADGSGPGRRAQRALARGF